MKIKAPGDHKDHLDVENPEAPSYAYRAVTHGTLVNLHSQLGWTPNYLDTSLRVFPERLNCGEKTHSECEWYHLMNKRSKGSQES